MPKRRTFRDTARIIREHKETLTRVDLSTDQVILSLANAFADLYTEGNPLFDRALFLKACGLSA